MPIEFLRKKSHSCILYFVFWENCVRDFLVRENEMQLRIMSLLYHCIVGESIAV